MADIINNPNDSRGSSSGGWVLGLVALVLLVLALIFFLVPNVTGTQTGATPDGVADDTGGEADNGPIPPVVNNTIINSTSSTVINATTTDEE